MDDLHLEDVQGFAAEVDVKNAALFFVMGAVAALVGGVLALRGGAAASPAAPAAVAPETAGSMAAPSGVGLPTTGSALGAVALQAAAGAPSAEGVIQDGEYRHTVVDPETRMALCWQNDSTTLCVGLSSPGPGWAAVGFSSQDGKKGSNILIGAVRDGKVVLQDHIGENRIDHRQDKVSSILTAGGSEAGGGTTLEFSIPLSSGDAEDVALVPGQNVAVILAFQATSDDFSREHSGRSSLWITLD